MQTISLDESGRAADHAALRGRLRWRCMRRGLLELDIVFERFLERHFDQIEAQQLDALGRLLDCEDIPLWAILSGREECSDAQLQPLVELLRSLR